LEKFADKVKKISVMARSAGFLWSFFYFYCIFEFKKRKGRGGGRGPTTPLRMRGGVWRPPPHHHLVFFNFRIEPWAVVIGFRLLRWLVINGGLVKGKHCDC